jgi:hypothetical protein
MSLDPQPLYVHLGSLIEIMPDLTAGFAERSHGPVGAGRNRPLGT